MLSRPGLSAVSKHGGVRAAIRYALRSSGLPFGRLRELDRVQLMHALVDRLRGDHVGHGEFHTVVLNAPFFKCAGDIAVDGIHSNSDRAFGVLRVQRV